MCGITGYYGNEDAKTICLAMLKKLEYRGYDSAGICFIENGKFIVKKRVGKVDKLVKSLKNNKKIYQLAIAHTRWATCGKVNKNNAHPHISSDWAIVHNGVIDNYQSLKNTYNLALKTETDSEVISALLCKRHVENISDFIDVCQLLSGSYAILAINKKTNKMFLAKNKAPIYVGKNENNFYVASDLYSFGKDVKTIYLMDNMEFAEISQKGFEVYNDRCEKREKKEMNSKEFECEKNVVDDKHIMHKEIKETSQRIRCLASFYKDNIKDIIKKISFEKIKNITLIGCGSAYNSALISKKFFSMYADKNISVICASEFDEKSSKITKDDLVVFVSQSGETADVLHCAYNLKNKCYKVVAVTNKIHSSLADLSDYVFPICAGDEIAVASTKAYVCQVLTLLVIALSISQKNEKKLYRYLTVEFKKLAKIIDENINLFEKSAESVCKIILKNKKIIFVGKGQDYFTAKEGNLKLKEISYFLSIAIPSGELKHGTLAVVDKKTLVVIVSTDEKMSSKIQTTKKEIVSRKGKTVLLSNYSMDSDILIPKTNSDFSPVISIVPLQLCAYSVAVKLKHNPDMPRNLAKSVTVE